jgi:TolA-binding protein
MKTDKRMTRHQIKEDRLVSTTFRATEYIQKNQTPFIIGTAVVVALFALVVFLRWSGTRKQDEAASILTRAEITAAMQNMDQYFADLSLLSDNYGGTAQGKLATSRLANNFFHNQDFARAEMYFQRIIDRYSNDQILSAGANAGLGSIYENNRDFARAGEHFKRAADLSDGQAWASGYLLKAGLNYSKAGNKEQAAAALNIIEQKYQNSPEFSSARRALAEISY